MATIFKSPSGSSIGSIFEVDTYDISLNAGITYQITLSGYAMDNYTGLSLKDPVIKAITYQGVAAKKLVSNVNNDNYPADDTWQTGEQMSFTPTQTGIYNVGVGVSGLFGAAGTYDLLVTGSIPVSTTPVISTKPSSGNDSITGTSGNDTIDGLAGADTMIGSLGNDIYIVDNVGDVVVETSTLTTEKDTVKSSVSYTMPANVENLFLGAGVLNGTGNAQDNMILGGVGNNTLNGGAGNDILWGEKYTKGETGNDILNGGDGNDGLTGGFGNDTLTGGAGSDDFNLSNRGIDTITDFTPKQDTISLSGGFPNFYDGDFYSTRLNPIQVQQFSL